MRGFCILLVSFLVLASARVSLAANRRRHRRDTELRAILDAPPPHPKKHTRPQVAQIYVQRVKRRVN